MILIRIGASPFFNNFVLRTENRIFIVPCFIIFFFKLVSTISYSVNLKDEQEVGKKVKNRWFFVDMV